MITSELLEYKKGESPIPPKIDNKDLISPVVKKKHKSFWHNLIFVGVGVLCLASWFFYSSPRANFWNSSLNRIEESNLQSLRSGVNNLEASYTSYWNSLEKISANSVSYAKTAYVVSWNFIKKTFTSFWSSLESFFVNSWKFLVNLIGKIHLPSFKLPSFNFKFPTFSLAGIFGSNKVANNPVVQTTVPVANTVRDCGATNSPDLKNKSTYEKNAVLSCIGNAALSCVNNAKAILKDPLFPSVVEIIKDKGVCNFKLSYAVDSTLVDVTGKKLALQSITCPISIVKTLNETQKVSLFTAPNISNPSQYASQIYFYGTLGLFIENNVDQSKIKNLGCSGSYVDSVIASYNQSSVKK